jgi:hypothetical protein
MHDHRQAVEEKPLDVVGRKFVGEDDMKVEFAKVTLPDEDVNSQLYDGKDEIQVGQLSGGLRLNDPSVPLDTEVVVNADGSDVRRQIGQRGDVARPGLGRVSITEVLLD